jgi:hypothetical protein
MRSNDPIIFTPTQRWRELAVLFARGLLRLPRRHSTAELAPTFLPEKAPDAPLKRECIAESTCGKNALQAHYLPAFLGSRQCFL